MGSVANSTPDHAGIREKRLPTLESGLRARLLVVAILVVGAFLRLHELAAVPYGLSGDEAFNGFDVLRVLDGARPVFLDANFGREALFIYLQAISVAILGRSDFAMHLVPAIVGVFTTAITYPLMRRLFDQRIAVLSCCWLASSLWHVIFSRIGLRAVSLPLFEAMAFYCFWRAWSSDGTSRIPRTA